MGLRHHDLRGPYLALRPPYASTPALGSEQVDSAWPSAPAVWDGLDPPGKACAEGETCPLPIQNCHRSDASLHVRPPCHPGTLHFIPRGASSICRFRELLERCAKFSPLALSEHVSCHMCDSRVQAAFALNTVTFHALSDNCSQEAI
jgi:hypothetical protein